MASYSLNAYDADIKINEFMGLEPFGDHFNGDVRFAADAMNMDVVSGMLQSPANLQTQNVHIPITVSDRPIRTLATYMRQNYAGGLGSNSELLVAAANGQLYYKPANEPTTAWTLLPFATDYPEANRDSYHLDYWSWTTYERANAESVLLLSNNQDGMLLINSGSNNVTPTVKWIDTQGYKFDTIAVYGERVWGSASKSNRDSIVYSAKFDPEDWTENVTTPEDGAGVIRQPTWDGDSIVRLQPFGGHLLVIMQRHIWRIYGRTPGEFTITEQFGEGAFCERSVINIGERVYMAGQHGVNVYDGQTSHPYLQEQTKTFWESVDFGTTLDSEHRRATNAIAYRNNYILSVPNYEMFEGHEVLSGFHLLIYNLSYGTVNIKKYLSANVYDMCATKYHTFFSVGWYIAEYEPDVWKEGCTSPNEDMYWVTPWIDFQNARLETTDYDIHFLPEVKASPVELVFTIETEKGEISKTVRIEPLTNREIDEGKHFKQKRVRFHLSGKRFRMKIERKYMPFIPGLMTLQEYNILSTAPWRFVGGIHIVADTMRAD